MLALILLILLLTTGCSNNPTVRHIPIPVACIKVMPPEPYIELDSVPREADIDKHVEALLIDHATLASSLKEHRALMTPCLLP